MSNPKIEIISASKLSKKDIIVFGKDKDRYEIEAIEESNLEKGVLKFTIVSLSSNPDYYGNRFTLKMSELEKIKRIDKQFFLTF